MVAEITVPWEVVEPEMVRHLQHLIRIDTTRVIFDLVTRFCT